MLTARLLFLRNNYMSLVFTALTPHSPLLIPNIGKENTSQFALTLKALEELSLGLEASKADTIVVLTSKGPVRDNEISINVSPHFRGNLELFGDLVTQSEFFGNTRLCGRLRERFETNLPISLITDEALDYASTIPLILLGAVNKKLIVPIALSADLGYNDLVTFGAALQDAIIADNSRIALIASADLSHRVNKKSPLGYSVKGKKFDQKILDLIQTNNLRELADMMTFADNAACEDMNVIISWMSFLKDIGGEMDLMQYEAPFGVGHLTARYDLGSHSS